MSENSTNEAVVKDPLLTDKLYNIGKDAATIWLPAAAALYSALAVIWGLPFSVEVVGTVAAIVTFLGAVLKISSNRYNNQPVEYNGALKVNMTDPLVDNYRLELDSDWQELAKKDEVRIKVVDESDPFSQSPEPLS